MMNFGSYDRMVATTLERITFNSGVFQWPDRYTWADSQVFGLLLDTATWPCQIKECKIILGAKSANWLAGWLTD